jgi:hypothetical protein
MTAGSLRGAVATMVAVLIAPASVVAANVGDAPRTAVTVPGFARSFDYDHGRAAWIDGAWTLHVRTLRTGAERTFRYTSQYEETPLLDYTNPFVEYHDVPWDRQLVLEQRKLTWESSRGCMGGPPGATVCEHIYAGSIDAKEGERIADADLLHDDNGAGRWLTGIAVDAQGLTYGVVEVTASEDLERMQAVDGGVWSVVDGIAHRLPDTPPALALARFAGRVAIEPADTAERGYGVPGGDGTIQIRDATTGALVSTFSPGKARALVLGTTAAVVLVGRRIVRYSVATGRVVASTPVPADTASELDLDGPRIAFRTRRAVEVLDTRSGKVATIATTPSPWRLTHVAIDGGIVAWTESKSASPGAVTSRKSFVTRIRTAPA